MSYGLGCRECQHYNPQMEGIFSDIIGAAKDVGGLLGIGKKKDAINPATTASGDAERIAINTQLFNAAKNGDKVALATLGQKAGLVAAAMDATTAWCGPSYGVAKRCDPWSTAAARSDAAAKYQQAQVSGGSAFPSLPSGVASASFAMPLMLAVVGVGAVLLLRKKGR